MARYFLSKLPPSESDNGAGSYWRTAESFSGWSGAGDTYESIFASGRAKGPSLRFHINLNLLSYACGDTLPVLTAGRTRVSARPYRILHGDPMGATSSDFLVQLQPFVEADDAAGTNAVEFPIGDGLRAFLDDPLAIGRSLNLALPYVDTQVTLSQAWMRQNPEPDAVVHGGFDLRSAVTPRPLHDVHAAADGEVVLLISGDPVMGHGGGVVLAHDVGGRRFLTLYQHVQPLSVSLAVGDWVPAGTKIGTIWRWTDPNERSHNHFNLLVQGPAFVHEGRDIPALWYSIDPFGVYDYHEADRYIPTAVDGVKSVIQGAERTIQWAGNPPILALPTEFTTEQALIRQIQVRARTKASDASAVMQHDQVLVWLTGVPEMHFVALGAALDRPIETELVRTLRRSHALGKQVRLGYRMYDGRREITAAWVRS